MKKGRLSKSAALKGEKHLIDRTGKMIFAGSACEGRASFVDHSGHYRISAEPMTGAAGRELGHHAFLEKLD